MSRSCVAVNGAPERVVGRELERRSPRCVDRTIASTRSDDVELPALALGRVVPASAATSRDHRVAVAAQRAGRCVGVPPAPSAAASGSSSSTVDARSFRPRGAGATGGWAGLEPRRPPPRSRHAPGGPRGTPPPRSRPRSARRPPRAPGARASGPIFVAGLAFAGRGRRGVAGLGVDAVDLEQPVRAPRPRPPRSWPASACAARNRAWAASFARADGARVGDRRGGLLGPREVLVVGALGGPQRLVGGAGAGPRADGELAALGGDAPHVGAAVTAPAPTSGAP